MRKPIIALCVLGLLLAGCARKEEAVPKLGGDSQTAIEKGVAFLVGAQGDDGSYGAPDYSAGMTAMAAVAIATAPKQLTDAEQQALDKAVAHILTKVQPDGSIHNQQLGYANYHTTLALMALVAVDRQKYAEQITRARSYLLGSQFSETHHNVSPDNPAYGGVRYDKTSGEANPDLSNTQFWVEALHAADLPKDSEAYKRAVLFLQRCQSRTESNDQPGIGDDGGAIYGPAASKADMVTLADGTEIYRSYGSMTYALLKSYIFCNVSKDDARVQAAYQWIQNNYDLEENVNMGKKGLYYNYLTMARALKAYGDPVLVTPDGVEHKWAEELAAKVASLQGPDGSWVNPDDKWMEGDKGLVTGYAVWTLNICREVMSQ